MAPCVCAYCGIGAFGHHMVYDLFGIIACVAHSDDASRDVSAWMHRNGQVRLGYAKTLDGIKPFFDALPATFSIRRTSGAIESGWRLPAGFGEVWARLKSMNGEWIMPVERIEENGDKWSRFVSLESFLEQDLAVPGITADVVAAAIAVLASGIYKAAADAADAAAALGPAQASNSAASSATNSAGTPLLVPMVINGVACRVIDHDGDVADKANAGKLPAGFEMATASFA